MPLIIKEKIPPRESILLMLEEATAWLSGEDISRRLGFSRAAVAKHVNALRSEGHAIEAVTRKGYRLLAKRDALSAATVVPCLDTNTFGQVGWNVLETTASTNLEAVYSAGEGAPEGYIVVAESQTKGRGRKGHDWFTVPRGIQFSVVLYPEASFWNAEEFTRLGALAVADAVKALTGLDAVFKTPNDVLLNRKKIAGVLVETGYRGSEPEWAVIGIGCNANALPGDFPESVRHKVTSIFAESGTAVSRAELLATILNRLEPAYAALRKECPNA